MNTVELRIGFTTPAFLGDADQRGEWRTPPIKAQLRHFWRMVQFAGGVCRVDELREREHALFGSASDGSGSSSKSLLRLRLSAWERGELADWGQLATRQISVGKNPVAAALYLGFGPLTYEKKLRGPAMAHAPAIDAASSATLRMAVVPRDPGKQGEAARHMDDLLQALALMHRFGTLGSRSRNGWGSYALDADNLPALDNRYLVPWRAALETDWPHGIGQDEDGALVWQSSNGFSNWEDAMVELAQLRADINRSGGDRTLLSHPLPKPKIRQGWSPQTRLPSSLRFKVTQDRQGAYRAQLAHFPCAPTEEMQKSGRVSMHDLLRTWELAHGHLADLVRKNQLQRVAQPGALQ